MPLTLQTVMKTLQQLKSKNSELPMGCSALELIDEDDALAWHLTLSYQHEQTVHVKLLFEVGSTRMPKVFVIQPRLKATFIHHGAVCARDLFEQNWELTLESVTMFIMSLHSTLDTAHGEVSMGAGGAAFSDADHQRGAQSIIEMHQQETRPPVATTTKPIAHADAVSPQRSHPTKLTPKATVSSSESLLQRAREGGVFHVAASIHVDSLRIVGGTFTLLASAAGVKLTVARSLIIGEGAALVLDGITLLVDEQIRVQGRLEAREGVLEGGVVADHNGALQCDSVALRGQLTLLDNAVAALANCVVTQVPVEATKEELSIHNKGAVFVGNNAQLTMKHCTVTPDARTTQCGIRGEQQATLLLDSTVVLCGLKACVHMIGGTSTLTRCFFADPSGEGVSLSSPKEKRTLGFEVEHGKVSAYRCVAFQVYFGFILLDKSVGTMEECFACDAVNGFTIDASTAVIQHCRALVEHVNVFVLSGGKCTVSAPRCDEASFRASRADNQHQTQVGLAIKAREALTPLARKPTAANFIDLQPSLFEPFECSPCLFLYGRYGVEVNKSNADVSMVLCIGAQEIGVSVVRSEVSLKHVSAVFRRLQAGIMVKNAKTEKNTGLLCRGPSAIDASHIDVSGYTFG
ncbi:Hypothetical protein, putative [Bodo saltans]|uniref:Uncharacterized protein n=1 Tax=Bodo saltans TaxID=75058 RepID=A0A0S4IUA8_BODSA|nr:Hypothetical protein, putative [Bodo saltans]|eukprot:CUF95026.1 Hypothetical protein, putative [Bodo saltans]